MINKEKAMPIFAGMAYALLFGLTFMFISIALRYTSPFLLLSIRFSIAFIVMSILVIFKILKVNFKNKNLLPLILVGFMQPILYFALETYALKSIPSSIAGTISSLIPISVALSSAYFLKEKPTKAQYGFILTSIVGVVIIVIFGATDSGSGSLVGILLLIGAILSQTAFTILSRKFSVRYTPTETTYFMMGIGGFVFTIIAFIECLIKGDLTAFITPFLHKEFIFTIIFLSIFASIMGFFLINYTLSKMEAARVAVFENLCTIVSIIAGVVFLGENFKVYHVIGAILIILGVWGTNRFTASNHKIIEEKAIDSTIREKNRD